MKSQIETFYLQMFLLMILVYLLRRNLLELSREELEEMIREELSANPFMETVEYDENQPECS